jgi:hypothetical protein
MLAVLQGRHTLCGAKPEAAGGWDIERNVIRHRRFHPERKYLSDGLARIAAFGSLEAAERRFVSRIQGRTYASMFGQLKREPLFQRIETMLAAQMPAGYVFVPRPAAVAAALSGRSAWANLALSCMMGLAAQAHYRQSVEPDASLDPLWKDIFLFHWKEEAQRAVADELDWRREDARLDGAARGRAVDELVALIAELDALLGRQASADAAYFTLAAGRAVDAGERAQLEAAFLHAYRWQYIVSGVQVPHISAVLGAMVDPAQYGRIAEALGPLF